MENLPLRAFNLLFPVVPLLAKVPEKDRCATERSNRALTSRPILILVKTLNGSRLWSALFLWICPTLFLAVFRPYTLHSVILRVLAGASGNSRTLATPLFNALLALWSGNGLRHRCLFAVLAFWTEYRCCSVPLVFFRTRFACYDILPIALAFLFPLLPFSPKRYSRSVPEVGYCL